MNTLSAAFGGLESILDAPVWVTLLVKATAILSAAWLVHSALTRANPRWRVLLWRATAVGLFVLPVLAWMLPALKIRVQSVQPVGSVAMHQEVPQASPSLDVTASSAHAIATLSDPRRVVVPPTDHRPLGENATTDATARLSTPTISDEAASQSPSGNGCSILTLCTAAWIAGVAILLLRLGLGQLRIRRIVGRAAPAGNSIRREAIRVARVIGCRAGVDIVQSADVPSPILCGLPRPRLLLPARMCEASYRADLPGILAHELAHVRSRDVLWNLVLQVIAIALWFHPIVWRIRKAHLAACELVCDAVSADFVGDVANYCRTLARVAVETCSPLPTAGIAMARTSSVGRRLAMLRTRVFHLPLRRRSVVAFALVMALAVGLIGSIQLALAAPPEPGGTPPSAAKGLANASNDSSTPSVPQDVPTSRGSLRVKVLDPQGRPLPDAKVHASIWTEEKGFKANRDYKTDAAGVAQVELPKTYFIVRLWASKKPFVTKFVHWEQNELASGKGLPEECVIRVKPGVTIGGRILDEQGKPIAGVKIDMRDHDAATTDAEGRWRIDCVSDNPKTELSLLVFHPDYVSDEYEGQLQKDAGITTAMLRDETAVLMLKRGVVARGRVTAPDGKPIKDALVVRLRADVMMMHNGCDLCERAPGDILTDADGRFRLRAMRPGETTLAVIAPGWAPQLRRVNLKADMQSEDFRVTRGKTIEIRFVDVVGKPVPGVDVQIGQVPGGRWFCNVESDRVDTKIPSKADQNGVWQWTWAPDGPVKLGTDMKGFASRELEIAGGAPPRTMTLKIEHRITGRVTDAVTGKPIAVFTVIPIDVFRKDWLHAERGNAKVGKDGRLDYLATRTDIPLRLRVEGVGYRTQTGPEFRVGDDSPRTQDFRLEPSQPVAGVVLDAAGQVVTNAVVLLATPTEQAELDDHGEITNNHKAISDTAGRFAFPDPAELFTVLARADAGFAMADFPADQHDAGPLRLRPWASVQGRFRDGDRPVKNATIFVSPIRLNSLDQPRIDATMQIRTDADGRFAFPRVMPGLVSVRAYIGPWRDEGFRSGPSVPLDLKPGQKIELDLGGAGTMVKGKVTLAFKLPADLDWIAIDRATVGEAVALAGNVPADLDCTYSLNYLIRREPGITPPPEIAKLGFDIRNGWKDIWRKVEGGQAYMGTLQHWFVKLAPDGAFQVSGVPAGEYDLAVEIYAKPSGCLVEPLARKVVPVTVTAEDVARGQMTLPEIAATVVPIPAVGDTPKLAFQRPDGTSGSLADFRGKNTLVQFWASWCGPCKEHLPALKALHGKLAARGYATVGLSLDEDAAVWQAATKQSDVPWPQGRLSAPCESGVSSVPAYWVLDPAGKIIAKATDVEELTAAVEKK